MAGYFSIRVSICEPLKRGKVKLMSENTRSHNQSVDLYYRFINYLKTKLCPQSVGFLRAKS